MSVSYIDCSPFMYDLLREENVSDFELRTYVGDPTPEQIPELVKGCRVVLNGHTMMDADVLDRCPEVRHIIFLGTGASSYIDIAAATERKIEVHTIKGYGDRSIAEHTFGLLLAAARRIVQMDTDLRHGIWHPQEGLELASATLGIIGCGGIGRSLVQIAQAFGMHVQIWNRSVLPEPFSSLQADFSTVVSQSDVVSLHLGYNDQTRHIIGEHELAMMKPGSILVNTARGGLVDTEALIAALQRQQSVHHAALDVYETEPLDGDHPLLQLPNVTLTAHAAFKTKAASRRLLCTALQRAQGVLSDKASSVS